MRWFNVAAVNRLTKCAGRGDIEPGRCEIAIVRQRRLERHGAPLVGQPESDAGQRVLAIAADLIAPRRL